MKARYLLSLILLISLYVPTSIFAQTAVVGAWNIQWLGTPEQRPNIAKGRAQKAEDIADYIIESGVDVLGLEEISDDDGVNGTYTNKTITRALQVIRNKTGQIWQYVLFPKRSGKTQLAGFAWNRNKARFIGQRKIPIDNSGGGAAWDRHPYAVKLSFGQGKTDAVFIVVHMKSNVGGAAVTRPQRAREARLLVEQLDFIRTFYDDEDIVIMGDTNVLSGQEEAVTTYVNSGFLDLNSENTPTTKEGDAPFDRIFVPEGQNEFQGSTMRVFRNDFLSSHSLSADTFFVRFSDHFMVTTRINVSKDDD
jgi:hypothetical protein